MRKRVTAKAAWAKVSAERIHCRRALEAILEIVSDPQMRSRAGALAPVLAQIEQLAFAALERPGHRSKAA